MARIYNNPPGVTVSEKVTNNPNPLISTPDLLCLVGPSGTNGKLTKSETIVASASPGSVLLGGPVAATVSNTAGSIKVYDLDPDSAVKVASNNSYSSTDGYPANCFTVTSTTSGGLTTNKVTTNATVRSTTLSGAINSSVATLTLTSVANLNDSGVIVIGTERIAYSSKSGSVLSGLTRGYGGTTAASHSDTDAVTIENSYIPDGRSLLVTYTYTPNDFFHPFAASAYDFSAIESRYGKAYDSTGLVVNSPITLAAKIAIENGASDFVIQPVFYSTDDPSTGAVTNRRAPTNAELASTSTTWGVTVNSLRNYDNIGIIVPVVGQISSSYGYGSDGPGSGAEFGDSKQLEVLNYIKNHIAYVDQNSGQTIIGIYGEDSTGGSYASTSTLNSHLANVQSGTVYGNTWASRQIFVLPTKLTRTSEASGDYVVYLGGQYLAAAIGGMIASRNAASPITRQGVAGFKTVEDLSSNKDKTTATGKGFLVVEQVTDGTIRVRHGVTTDNTSSSTAEISVIRAKALMVNSLQDTIDTQVIGKLVADDQAPLIVESVVAGVLRTLQDDGQLVGFSAVQANITSVNPTTIEVRFNYRPAFPVNYIQIVFSIDLTSGGTSVADTTTTTTGA